MPVERVIMAVNSLDLKQVPLENVEILQRMIPTDQEVNILVLNLKFLLIYLIIYISNKFFKF